MSDSHHAALPPTDDPPEEGLQAKDIREYFAVVYTPRRQRRRFPENCVHLVDSEALARAQAHAQQHRHAAKVCGPSRSSEGVRLYYLVCWLDA